MLNTRILDNENAFFTVLFSDDLWKQLKKHMFPGFRTNNLYNYRDGYAAIKQDYLTLIKENNNLVFPLNSIDFAAMNGRLDIIKYLHINNLSECTIGAMDFAAAYGHFEVVRWLHYNRTEGCSTTAMDIAAALGYLPIVEFLHNNRNEGCTTYAMEAAAREGHLEIVIFLYYNVHTLRLSVNKALNNAAKKGHLEIVKFLYHVRISKSYMYKLLNQAIYDDDFKTAEYINNNIKEFSQEERTISLARKNSHMEIVMFLENN